jgi:hypothetical protein
MVVVQNGWDDDDKGMSLGMEYQGTMTDPEARRGLREGSGVQQRIQLRQTDNLVESA